MTKRWQILQYSGKEDPAESLLSAVFTGNLEWILRHLENGADVNMRSDDEWTPLIEAAVGAPEITRLLLKAGAKPDLHTKKKYTPLMRAAGFGNLEVVKLLVEAGANLFARDDLGQTALDMTDGANFPETRGYLLEAMKHAGSGKSTSTLSTVVSSPSEQKLAASSTDMLENDTKVLTSLGKGTGEMKKPLTRVSSRPRSVAIFLSSTFRDMHAERDYLRDKIFPVLEERLEELGIQLETIDLRFGVETVSIAEEQEKSLHVLKVCLAEVQRSRPFFIGLLGDRYGWILPDQALSNAAREVGKTQSVGKMSVTELEIDFGLETIPGARRALVFIRDPLPYDQLLKDGQMSPIEAARYSDLHGDAEQADSHEKLLALKAHLKNNHCRITHSYSAKWNSQEHRLTGLEEWGDKMIDLLWAELRDETADWAQQAVQWQVNEKETLSRLWQNHILQFAGREIELKRLISFAQSTDNSQWVGLVTSGDGYGKSAIMAKLCNELEQRGVWVLSHSVGITAKSLSIELMQRRFIYELSNLLNETVELPESCNLNQVTTTFWSLLQQAGIKNRVVLLVDNIDLFRREHNPRLDTTSAGWLSSNWPENVRLITSAREGLTAQSLRDRVGVLEISPGDLDIKARNHLIKTVCDRYHRDLGPAVREELIGRTRPDGSAASSHPLWLTLATEAINLLDADDFQRTETEFIGSADERIEQLLLHTVRLLPTDVDGLYLWTLQRARELHDQELADGFVKLTAVSRYGLRESDYRVLLPEISNQHWDSLRFAMLRRTFRTLVQFRVDDSRCSFTQQGMQDFILNSCLPETSERKRLHIRLAEYLRGLPTSDLMRQQETMYHLVQGHEALLSAQYLCDCVEQTEKMGDSPAASVAAVHILAENARDHREPFIDWMTSWLGLEDLSIKHRATLAGLFGQVLDRLLTDSVGLSLRKRMHESIRHYLSKIVTDKTDATLARQLVGSHSFLGSVLLSEGKAESAFKEFQEGQSLANELVRLNPGSIEDKNNLAQMTLDLAGLLLDSGKSAQAKPYFDKLVLLRREILKLEYNNRNIELLASALARLGHVCYNLRLIADAKGHLMEARDSIQGLQDVRQLLGDISEHMGNIADTEGRLDDALGFYQDVVSEREPELATSPNDRHSHFRLCIAYKNLGSTYFKLKHFEESNICYDKALTLIRRMIGIDPANTKWHHELGVVLERMGRVRIEQQQVNDAISLLLKSASVFDRLLNDDPGNLQLHADLLKTHFSIGEIHLKTKNFNQGIEVFTHCIEIAEKRLSLEPGNPTARREMAVVHGKVGVAFMAANNYEMARSPLEQALNLGEHNRQLLPNDSHLLEDCVGFLWNLGRVYIELQNHRDAEKCFRLCRDRLKLMQMKGFPINSMHRQVLDILTDMNL